jgi:hypothetical protein
VGSRDVAAASVGTDEHRVSGADAGADVPAETAEDHSQVPTVPIWLIVIGALLAVAIVSVSGYYHFRVYTPQPDRAHRLALIDRVFVVSVAAAILIDGLLLGLRIASMLRVRAHFDDIETVALAAGLGLGGLSMVVLLLGMVHLYYPVTFGVLLLALPVLLPAERRWVWRHGFQVGAWAVRHTQAATWRRQPLFDTLASWTLGVLCASVAALTFAADLTLPTYGYDTYQYHWAVPQLLLLTHDMRAFPGWAHANLPYNTEVLNLIALALRAPEAATMVQDSFQLLFGLLIFSLVRRHFAIVAAWLAVAATVTVPLLVVYTSLSYVETALFFYGVAALVVVLRWIEREEQGTGGAGRAGFLLLTLAGLFLGLGLGVKYTALEYVVGIAGLVVLAVPIVAVRWHAIRRAKPLIVHALKAYGVFFGAMIGALAPWLIKNWLLLGNPVYPALASIFGAPLWNAARDQTLESTFQSFGPHQDWAYQLHLFAIDVFVHPQSYWPLGALLLVPFVWLALRRRRTTGRSDLTSGQVTVVVALGAVTVVSFLVWTFSGALVERYALPAILLATVLGASLIGWAIRSVSRRTFALGALALLAPVMVCAHMELANPWPNTRGQVQRAVLLGHTSETKFERSRIVGLSRDSWYIIIDVNNSLPHDGKLLMLGRGTGYFITDRDYVADSGGDWIPYLVSAGKTPDGIVHILQQQGFTYVVYDDVVVRYLIQQYKNTALASYLPMWKQTARCDLTLLMHYGDVSLYRVPSPGSPLPASSPRRLQRPPDNRPYGPMPLPGGHGR